VFDTIGQTCASRTVNGRVPAGAALWRQGKLAGASLPGLHTAAHSLSSWLAPMRARAVLHTGQDGAAWRFCAASTTMSRQNRQKSCPHLETTGSTIRSVWAAGQQEGGSDRALAEWLASAAASTGDCWVWL
jgi:hypothetical protein